MASYLVNDLALDWRMDTYWFRAATSSTTTRAATGAIGNTSPAWAMIHRDGRRFDPVRRAGMYDPEGVYVQHWADN
ncbi:MAG: FAD-binding domain-containing protein [Flavobacteriales bacterium]